MLLGLADSGLNKPSSHQPQLAGLCYHSLGLGPRARSCLPAGRYPVRLTLGPAPAIPSKYPDGSCPLLPLLAPFRALGRPLTTSHVGTPALGPVCLD